MSVAIGERTRALSRCEDDGDALLTGAEVRGGEDCLQAVGRDGTLDELDFFKLRVLAAFGGGSPCQRCHLLAGDCREHEDGC